VFAVKIVNHDRRRGNTAQALALWWHPVASSEALYVPHWEMCPALYHHIRVVIKISRDLLVFFVIVVLIIPKTTDNNHVMVNINYHSVVYYVNIIFVYYGHPPTTKDDISATIVDGGRAMCLHYTLFPA
jgi:hypothetical protein